MTDSQKTSHLAAVAQAERARVAEAQVAALLQDKAAAHARAEEREAEIDALTGQVAALVEALITAVSALENYGDHHEWCAKQYCTCGYGGYLIEGHRLLSDLSAAAAEHDARVAREAVAAERERLRVIFDGHPPMENRDSRTGPECANGNCGNEPYEDHILTLLSEEAER